MIERCRRPACLSMAVVAADAIAAAVRLLLGMARVAILEGNGEIAEAAGVEMAPVTGQPGMLPLELEWKSAVVEMVPKPIDTIVTVEAGSSVG